MNFKQGELFLYQLDEKYGVIQVIEKSKNSGYNVRIFCDLINEISEESVDIIIQSDKYYFIKDFYTDDLMKSNYRMIRFMNSKIVMPKYMRCCERKNNGNLIWYIINVDKGKIVKKFNNFDEELLSLSPSETWGIEYIKKRWLENFDLKKWNNELMNSWYLNYLKIYEPYKVYDFNMSLMSHDSLLEKWKTNRKFHRGIIDSLEIIFKDLIKNISNDKDHDLFKDKYLEDFIFKLNKLNDKFYFIETVESEELMEYINYLLIINNIEDDNDIIDKFRNW